MKRTRRSAAVGSVLAVLFTGMAMVTSSAGAQTPAIACGSVITGNTTLQANVGPCNNGNGLIVRGSNFTLNLNGFRVFSNAPLPRNLGVAPGPGNQPWIPGDVVGILLDNATNVTVRGGTVERFTAGISIEGGSGNTILGVTAQDNQGPCIGEDFSTFATGEYGDGIAVFGSPNNRLINNTIRRNGPFSGIALIANNIFITRAVQPYPSGTVVAGNLIEDHNICFADIGIRMEGPGASNTVVRNNTVRNSFQEGIVVHPVNTIDFEPLFRNPPQCQNRGFPSPNLPLCPIQNPENPGNDRNIVSANRVENNGYGGAEINAGPNLPNLPSPQVAVGLNLLSFCGYGAKNQGIGNVVQGNLVTRNAGDGIRVGGCPLGQNPAQGTFPGFTETRVVGNTSFNNNGRQCGIPGSPFFGISPCGTRGNVMNFDLHDTNHETTCPAVPAAGNATDAARAAAERQRAFCATQGFPNFAPATGPFVATRVTQAGGQPCDNNIWFGNRYGTAFPPCTTVGGQQISVPQPSGPSTAVQAAEDVGAAAETQTDFERRPLRGGYKALQEAQASR